MSMARWHLCSTVAYSINSPGYNCVNIQICIVCKLQCDLAFENTGSRENSPSWDALTELTDAVVPDSDAARSCAHLQGPHVRQLCFFLLGITSRLILYSGSAVVDLPLRVALRWQADCAKQRCCTASKWWPRKPRGRTCWPQPPTERPR